MVENKDEQVGTAEEKNEKAAGAGPEGDVKENQEIEGQDAAGDASDVNKAEFSDLGSPSPGGGIVNNFDLLLDVTVPLTVELGHSVMKIEDVLQLSPGSVIDLDRNADEPVDLKINGKLVARGEIVVVGNCFGIRVSEILETGKNIL